MREKERERERKREKEREGKREKREEREIRGDGEIERTRNTYLPHKIQIHTYSRNKKKRRIHRAQVVNFSFTDEFVSVCLLSISFSPSDSSYIAIFISLSSLYPLSFSASIFLSLYPL